MFLEKINSPLDLKKIKIENLNVLSNEIRNFLIENISKTGGHLASNLGVVELTIALHYCFDSPKDKIIWDVGHQSYVHKILTGRKDKFNTLRKFNGLSGFPKNSESKHDVFDVGHSSTSISAGLGYVASRDLNKENFKVVSIIGDGSMTSGISFEALNNAGQLNSNFIVILNDNEMSISENVGGLTKHLNSIRTAPYYIETKKGVNKILDNIPVVGNYIAKSLDKAKEKIKYFLISGILFEELGFKYVGPIDGHNISEMTKIFNQAKKINGPVLLHVHTKKGKGYKFAEEKPENFHGVSPFNIKTGKQLDTKRVETYSDVFGNKMIELAKRNKKIVAITAAMPQGVGLKNYKKLFKERLFDVGIAEGHAVTFAAGLAKNNHIPVVAIYSTFLQRAYDQILHDVCIQNLHVVFAIDRGGIVGSDGETHQGIFDLSYLSHLPNMTIIAPKNKLELENMLDFSINYNKPIAIRYPRGKASTIFEEVNNKIELGKSEILIEETENIIISVGDMMDTSYEVYKKLKGNNIPVTLVNLRFIKPLDLDLIKSLENYKNVFVIENNIKTGGAYSNILEKLSDFKIKSNIYSFSFPDEFIQHGSVNEIFKKYNLDSNSIYEKILDII